MGEKKILGKLGAGKNTAPGIWDPGTIPEQGSKEGGDGEYCWVSALWKCQNIREGAPTPPWLPGSYKIHFYSMHRSHRKVVNIHSLKNAHGKDILHLRERSELILYAAERLFSNHKLVNLNFLSEKI